MLLSRSQIRRHPVLAFLALFSLLVAGWLLYLNFSITQKFDGRRWDLPAQVFARPLELYAGLDLTAARLEQELLRLGYAPVAGQPRRPGSFRRTARELSLVSRPFRFWDQRQPALALQVEFTGPAIRRLRNDKGDVPIARLDPLMVGSIFPTHGEDRLIVTPDQTPPLLTAALQAVEDRRFNEHHGIDPRALLRAMLVNLRSGELSQGGSTLTQQLVKNYFLDNRRTLWRKIREAAMAVILELHYDKADLLNAYINEIYMGQDGIRAIHGFGLASQFYFSRPLDELATHQLALLVALVKGPGYYSPTRHPARARERRNLVLQILADDGILTPAAAASAQQQALDTWNSRQAGSSYYPAFLQLVRQQLSTEYRDEDLTGAGLRVFTALDPLVQASAEAQLAAGLKALDGRKPDAEQKLAGAAVISSTQSGEVLAIVGDRRAGFDGFNRALAARRPIGSLVKPAVYLAALETGRYTLASVIDDSPISVPLATGGTWDPQNYDKESHGRVTLLRALVESFNLATVRLGLEIGLDPVADTLTRLGGPAQINRFPSLLLGAIEMTPLQVTQVYGTLANGGFLTPLRTVRSVVDATGEPLQRYPVAIAQVAEPAAIYPLNQALTEVIRRGTARTARDQLPPQLVAAGKTGTSDEYRDSWFAGFTGEHVMVVWVGYDDNQPTGLTGASGALGIWTNIMGELSSASFNPLLPGRLENQWIDYETGLLSRPACADVVALALPTDTRLQSKPGCGPGLRQLGRRARRWLEEKAN
jgi:penicillin-binding protein 1B